MQRAYRRIYKSVGTKERMVSRIQGSKIGNEKISTRTGNHKNISELRTTDAEAWPHRKMSFRGLGDSPTSGA